MQTNQGFGINEPLRTTRGWQAEDNRSRTSRTALFLLAVIAGCASAPADKPLVQVPEKLSPGADESLAMVISARGVQIYECRAAKDLRGNYEWAFVAPEADLFDAAGKQVGRHYAGPHWESLDGSKIVGTVKANAPAPAAGAIPWLLLAAKPAGADGLFSKITSLQRVSTAGGVAPQAGCSEALAGTRARVDYTADYYFFAKK